MHRYDPKLYKKFIKKFGHNHWIEMFNALSIVAYGNQTFIHPEGVPTELPTPCRIGHFYFEFFEFEKGSHPQRPHSAVGYYDDGKIGFAFMIKKSVGMREILALKIKKD